MKSLKKMVVYFLLMSVIPLTAQSKKEKELIAESKKAIATLLEVNPSLRAYFDKSAGCVVFPNVGKGGFIIGGASGNGILYSYGKEQGLASLKELNVGLQAGGEALIEVIFFERKEDIEEFKEGKFQFDAGVSATALKAGVSLDAAYKDGVAVFTHTKGGLMAEASVGGQKFNYKPFRK